MTTPRQAPRHGFTLIELLVVIAIIGLLASITVPMLRGSTQKVRLTQAQAQLLQVGTAIESYKSKLGHYPPDNPANPSLSPLFYELTGTSNNPAGVFVVTGQRGDPNLTAASINAAFGRAGFVNISTPGSSDDALTSKYFATGLGPNQHDLVQGPGNSVVRIVVSPIQGPPSGITSSPAGKQINPVNYLCTNPKYNTTSFDLWVDISVGGKIYRVSNWSKDPIPSPPPYGN